MSNRDDDRREILQVLAVLLGMAALCVLLLVLWRVPLAPLLNVLAAVLCFLLPLSLLTAAAIYALPSVCLERSRRTEEARNPRLHAGDAMAQQFGPPTRGVWEDEA